MSIKYFVLSVSILLMSAQKGFGQNSSSKTSMIRLVGGIAFRPVAMNATNVYFRYVDESPSQDNIRSTFSVAQKTSAFCVRFGGELNWDEKYFGSAGAELALDNTQTFAIHLGVGRIFPKKYFTLRPEIAIEFGSRGIGLGSIYNNAVYIQVNEQEFYSKTVSVSLEKSFFAVRPMIGIYKPLPFGSGDFAVSAQLGYNLAVNVGGMYLSFAGTDKEEKSASATESINANNVYLGLNSGVVDKSFIKHSGIYFNVSLMYTLM